MDGKHSEQVAKARSFLEESEVDWVRFFFTDLSGTLRALTVPAGALQDEGMWKHGKSIDGSSAGFSTIESSDAYVRPDPSTVRLLPYTSEGLAIARVFADILGSDAVSPHPNDPRGIARKAEEALLQAGFSGVRFQPELEFYLFDNLDDALAKNDLLDGNHPPGLGTGITQSDLLGHLEDGMPNPGADRAYLASSPIDRFDSFRDLFCSLLEDASVPIKFHHHECGSSQQEIEFKFVEGPVEASDTSMYYKHLARQLAADRGMRATFMPKPITGDAGSGMHYHILVERDGKNAFADTDDEYGLSQTGRYFLGGILEHARALCAVTNPSTNSYRRLVPNSEAPTMVAWGPSNRSAMARIPARGKVGLTDIEIRNPDPLSNPYLVTALLIHAGLDGVRKKTDPGDPHTENLYHLTPSQIRARGIKTLPRSLREAVYEFVEDPLMREVLGEHAFSKMLGHLEKQVFEGQRRVPSWEIAAYFDG